MIFGALMLSTLVAANALAAAYALAALWIPAVVILFLGIPIIGERDGTRAWIPTLAVAMLALTAAVGAPLGLHPWLLVLGMTAALSAWNLAAFARRLGSVDAVEHEQALKHRHLRRLLIVDGLGFLLAAVALGVRVNLSFGLGVVLALIALVALSRAIGFLGRTDAS